MTKRLGDRETSDFPVSSFRAKREIFVIRGEGLTLSPHVPRTSPLFSSVFHTTCALSAPSGHLPLEGKAIKFKRKNVLGSPSGELPEGLVQANWIFRSEATQKSSETPFRTK